MKLRRLQIENFRGITSLDMEIGDTTVLIGENNTGKTAMLDALRFALRDVRSRRGCAFDAYDFHLKDAKSEPSMAPAISICLTFREDEPNEWDKQLIGTMSRSQILQTDTNGRMCIMLKVGARFDTGTQEFIHDWEFRNLTGAPLTTYADSALSIFRNEVSYYYLSALRDAAKHFDDKGIFWRPFLKESQLTQENREKIEKILAEVNQLIVSSHVNFSQVVEKLREINEVVSMGGDHDLVSIDAVPGRLFDVLAKAQLNLNTGTGAKIPVGRHGEGMQSLAVLTLFNAFLQTWNKGTAIVAMEEPEAHLHPSAVRALWKLIERIPGQKIISTHSGDLLSEVPSEVVTRLHKRAGTVEAACLKNADLNADETRKFDFHIRRTRGDLLFAKCWILGEGETEATLISECARVLKDDLERIGIRFVTCQTGISPALGLKVANCMGIDWVVLADNDQQGKNYHKAVRDHLDGRVENEVLFTMKEKDIEHYLCANGFLDVYLGLLGDQPIKKVDALPDDPKYPEQIADALPKNQKTKAVQKVLEAIGGDPLNVPSLFRDVIDAAIKLAKIE
ncbi:MAG: DUF2813 domain-containing protein [Magnetococcales bacterium]|nr:DUF2813 domain-containing protein [Magnetococcales bacterium]